MLRWPHFCSSARTCHVTLRTCFGVRWAHFVHTSFVRKASAKLTVFTCPSTFFGIFTARTPSCSLREHVLIPGCGTEGQCSAWLGEPPQGQFAKSVRRVQRGSPKVPAHTGNCWPACNKMLPGSLWNQSLMIMMYATVWQWWYIHKNAVVRDITARTLHTLVWREKNSWHRGET